MSYSGSSFYWPFLQRKICLELDEMSHFWQLLFARYATANKSFFRRVTRKRKSILLFASRIWHQDGSCPVKLFMSSYSKTLLGLTRWIWN